MHRSLEQNSPGNHGPDGHLSFNLQQTDPQNTFAIASKISLALAILRTKPAGISASDFTLQICRYYKTKENWKNQIESLQIQAMSYQQEILQTWNQEHSQETETDTSEEDTSKMGIKCNNTESYIEILVTMNEIPDVRIAVLSQLLEYTLEFSRYLQESVKQQLFQGLDECGILIGREFPLVSGYIWTFLGLLDASLMS
ncbi:uncharacterized protein TRIADDRAFT_53258 [Trichoplax adhaerens]|uniref:Uncharacterized protein n=1 Tax=Trichoplax adhaerens TaxID=10228 RepID=B3RNR3_TRIAD|nr:predicted protein [Trichoplax adhaerens]EDV27506.1 predicted protein [Trichoplax adhaerens]|eukprot:XP_002109340.1 predicted protein [Trichoplax adhaerens]